jgi:hypothetical protein
MDEDMELFNEIIWVMKHYGSDAGEKAKLGGKLVAQAKRIVEFVRQRNMAYELLSTHGLDLVRVKSSTIID